MKQATSIFNDVIGPVMVGPSSSHTAAGVRIGYYIRALANQAPETVVFYFSKQGSLADCHEPQGSDIGLAGGILGFAPEDTRIGDSMRLAKDAGIDIQFIITDDPVPHPNTYPFSVIGGGRTCTGEAISIGGGMIEVTRLFDIPVSMTGGYHEVILLLGKSDLKIAQELVEALNPDNYEGVTIHSNDHGNYLINIKSTRKVDSSAWKTKPVVDWVEFPPVLPIMSQKERLVPWNTAHEIESIASEQGLELWEITSEYEAQRGSISRDEVFQRMQGLVAIIEKTLEKVEREPKDYADRILGPQAHLLGKAKQLLPDPLLNSVIKNVTLLMEAKSSLEVVVAAPTAGACAALPGTLIGVAQILGLSQQKVTEGMLAAAGIGVLIMEHSTIAGEVGGCQAECGSATAMAAAGLVQMMGGTVQQSLAAASMALQNILGMVCDPVAERVEVPCLGRNVLAGVNAMSMANMALAGFDAVIPLDEVIETAYKIGLMTDPSLKCTCQAGLSVTLASKERLRILQEKKLSITAPIKS